MATQFTVIADTREKTPLQFKDDCVIEVLPSKLDTGDYTVQGLEDILCIERKRGVSEIANNSTEKRFTQVLERMRKFKYQYILLEFSIDDVMKYPVGSSVPRNRWKTLKIKGPFIMSFISSIMVVYNIPVLFCGNTEGAAKMATSIMKNIYRVENKNL